MSAGKGPYGFFGLLWRLALAGAVVYSVAGAGSYWAVQRMVRTPDDQAPDLLTMTVEEALDEASKRGFAVIVESREPTTLLEAGRIISQRPVPGAWVKANSIVRITVATKQ